MTPPGDERLRPDEQRGLRRVAAAAFVKLPAPARRSILHAFGKYAPWEAGFDPKPPTAGPDEVTGPPDFVGIGAQKAGTTWWYEAVCAHPDAHAGELHCGPVSVPVAHTSQPSLD